MLLVYILDESSLVKPSELGRFSLCVGKAPAVVSAVAKLVSTKATGLIVKLDPSDTEEDNSEDEASTTLHAQESQSRPKTPSVARQDTSGAGEEDLNVSFTAVS